MTFFFQMNPIRVILKSVLALLSVTMRISRCFLSTVQKTWNKARASVIKHASHGSGGWIKASCSKSMCFWRVFSLSWRENKTKRRSLIISTKRGLLKNVLLRDVTIHSTHDSIQDFDFMIRFTVVINKMRFKTNYKLNVLLLLLGQNAAHLFVKLKYNTIIIY